MAKRSSSEVVLRQKRKRMSKEKAAELEKRYPEEGSMPDIERMTTLAHDLGLDLKQVAVWFQNKRARVKAELAKKELETENYLLRAKNEQSEAIIRGLKASIEQLKSQLLVMERQRGMMNTEVAAAWNPAVGFTAAGTSSGIELVADPAGIVAAPAEIGAAPAYDNQHLLQGTVNQQANMFNIDGFEQDNMFNTCYDFGGYYPDFQQYFP